MRWSWFNITSYNKILWGAFNNSDCKAEWRTEANLT